MTPRQSQALAAIRRLTVDGVSPTYDELARELGLAAKSSAFRLVEQLAEQGVVASTSRDRSIVILDDYLSPATLNAMSDAALNDGLAHIAGILAHRRGGYPTAKTLRRIADALLTAPKARAVA